MSETKPELKTCSRCGCEILLSYFETNRKGELFKTCNKCRNRKDKKDQLIIIYPERFIGEPRQSKTYEEKVIEAKKQKKLEDKQYLELANAFKAYEELKIKNSLMDFIKKHLRKSIESLHTPILWN